MKNILRFCIFFFILNTYTIGYGQVLNFARYSNNSFTNIFPLTASDVTSDFGMRNPGGQGTLFHRGVDIKPVGDQDLVILAPFQGEIILIRQGLTGIIDMIIESTAGPSIRLDLLHIFNNLGFPIISNGFELRLVSGTYIIIDRINCRAFSSTPNIPVICNGQTINTITTFDPNWPIAPMGNSGYVKGSPYPYHLHLSQLENNSTDNSSKDNSIDALHDIQMSPTTGPLGIRLRRREFSPNININCTTHCEQNNNYGTWAAFAPTYTNDTRNIIQTEISMVGATPPPNPSPPPPPASQNLDDRYSNGFTNESLIKVNIRNTNSGTFQEINGARNFARFRIDPRGSQTIYPNNIKNGIYGNLSETGAGCAPYAYTSGIGFNPYDYYVTPDFYLRIHKGNVPVDNQAVKLATYTWDARYMDGNYQLQAEVVTINNQTTQSSLIDFQIDNFKPFIRSVGIYSGSGGPNDEQIYYREWTSQNAPSGQLRLAGVPPRNPASLLNQVVTIYAVASESMRVVKAKLPPLVNGFVTGTPVLGSDRKTWQFQFSAINFTEDVCYGVIFEGEDLHGNAVGQGNQLLDLPEPYTCNLGTGSTFNVPYRTGTNTWSVGPAQGADEVHKFRTGKCGMLAASSQSDSNGPPPCFTSNEVTYDVTSSAPGENTGSIKMIIANAPSGMGIRWTNAAGDVIGDSENLSDLLAGLYCVQIQYDCCSFYDCIEVPECALNVVATATYSSSFAPTGSATLTISNGMEPYQIQWSNGATSQQVTELAAGEYTFAITDAYHCVTYGSVEVPVCTSIEVDPDVTVLGACNGNSGSIQVNKFHANGGVAPYTYYWRYEDGEPLDEPADLGPGIYCLVATDANGCTGIKCFSVAQSTFSTNDVYIKEIRNVSSCWVHPTPAVFDACDGAIALGLSEEAQSGSSQFTYRWSGSNGFTGDKASIERLCVGFYDVTVTNAEGCSVVKSFNICCCEDQSTQGQFPNVCPKEEYTISGKYTVITAPQPENDYQGSIDISIDGSSYSTGYYYTWSGPDGFTAHTEDIKNLQPGNYCVTITNGCKGEIYKCFDLGRCDAANTPAIQTSVSNSCEGGHSGKILVSIRQGMPPYTILWDGGSVTTLEQSYPIKGLEAGTYTITVTDAKYCTATATVTIGIDSPYDFDFPMDVVEPFELVNPCFKGIFKPKIKIPDGINSDCTGGTTQIEPNEYPYKLGIEWPDLSTSILVLEEGGGCHTEGPNVFDVGPADLYHCAVIDKYGCRKKWCFEFGEETSISYPQINTFPPKGGGDPITALNSCIKCTNCGEKDCPGSFPKDCESDIDLKYEPKNEENPCSGGGTLTIPCDNSVIEIPAVYGVEYVDWESGKGVAEGICEYEVGCLFLGLHNSLFQGAPVYVNTTIRLNNPECHAPVITPGNTYSSCLTGIDYIVGNDEECTGKVVCRLTGETLFEGILDKYTRTCYRINENGSCDKLTFCTLTDPEILLETVPNVECPPECDENPDYCEPCKPRPASNQRNTQNGSAVKDDVALKMRAYPNPFDQFMMIEFDSEKEQDAVQIFITDLVGRVKWERNTPLHPGKNRFPISAGEGFAPGIYYISVKDNEGHSTTTKLVRIGK